MLKTFLPLYLAFSFFNLQGEEPYPRRFEGVFQEYDSDRLFLIQRFLPYNPIIIEAGGHYGTDTVRFSNTWPAGKVFSFEPNPHAFEKLCNATSLLKNVYPKNLALNNYNGEVTMYVCYGTTGDNPEFEGASSLLPPSEGMQQHYQGPLVDVPCVVLDDWCKENGIDHVDFMWLDLEGLELQILKSSPEILKTVKLIYTETNLFPFRVGTSLYPELKEFLLQSGFKLLSHWYREGLQGDAIFLKAELYNAVFRGSNL